MGYAQRRFFTVRNSLFEETARSLPHAHFKVYLFILRKARDRRAEVTIREISEATGVSERHVKRAIQDLKKRAMIFVFRVGRRNVYVLPEKNPGRREGHFFRVFNRVFDEGHAARMTHATFKVYMFLRRRGGREIIIPFSLEDIARHTGVSSRHAKRCLRWLRENRYIRFLKLRDRVVVHILELPELGHVNPWKNEGLKHLHRFPEKPERPRVDREGPERPSLGQFALRNRKDESLLSLVRRMGIPVPPSAGGGT